MMKKVVPAMILLIIGMVFFLDHKSSAKSYEDTTAVSSSISENIEALADDEYDGPVQVQCNGSVIISCQVTCLSCFSKYEAKSARGCATAVRGKCSCGSTHFSLF